MVRRVAPTVTRRLRIGRHRWTIRYVRDLEARVADRMRLEDDKDLHGVTLHDRREILIGSRYSEPTRTETLVHELLHAAMPRFTEGTVRALAARITPALRRYGLRG